jgi:uncharacterized protein YutE (UPF0331/DUF86 family)
MTDAELVEKKLAFIESCISELRRLAAPERLQTDLREQRFVLYTLQIAIQAALDAASHIVSDERLGEPTSNAELFALLQRAGVLSPELTGKLTRMAGFRNLVVHAYVSVDMAIVARILAHDLGDLEAFAGSVRTYLGTSGPS